MENKRLELSEHKGVFNISSGFLIMCLGISIYIIINPIKQPGLSALFCLPLALGIGAVLVGDIFSEWKDSMGLSVLLICLFLKYAVSPLLISISGSVGYPGILVASEYGYTFAIIFSFLELCVTILALRIIWKKKTKRKSSSHNDDFFISPLVLIILLALFGVVVVRTDFFKLYSYITNIFSYKQEQIYSIELIIILVVKTLLYITMLSWCKRKYNNGFTPSRNKYFLLALIASGLNVMINDPYGRAIIVESLLASIACLMFSFPNMKRTVLKIGILLGSATILASIVYLNFGYEGGSSGFKYVKNLGHASYILETYVNGLTPLGWSYDISNSVSNSVSIATFFSDIFNSINPLTLPLFSAFKFGLQNEKTTAILFNESMPFSIGYILPFAGEAIYYSNVFIGGLLDAFYCVFCVSFLRKLDYASKNETSVEFQYVFAFCSTIFAFFLCYNAMIIIASITYIPLYVFLFSKLNRLLKHKKE